MQATTIPMTRPHADIVARALHLVTCSDAESVLRQAYLLKSHEDRTASGRPLFQTVDPVKALADAWRNFLDSCAAAGADPAESLTATAKWNATAAPMLPAVLEQLPARVAEHGRARR